MKSEYETLPGSLVQEKYSNLSQKIQLGNFRFFSAAQVCVANHIPAVICRCCSVSNIVYIFTATNWPPHSNSDPRGRSRGKSREGQLCEEGSSNLIVGQIQRKISKLDQIKRCHHASLRTGSLPSQVNRQSQFENFTIKRRIKVGEKIFRRVHHNVS